MEIVLDMSKTLITSIHFLMQTCQMVAWQMKVIVIYIFHLN